MAVYMAVELGWTKTPGIIDRQHDYFKNQASTMNETSATSTNQAWSQGDEWQTLKDAVTKDKDVIDKVSQETGVPSRTIVSVLIVEQLRLFHDDREIYKQVFAPLKILGNQSQFSWGVMGIKQDTAKEIENNLKDPTSPWYLGPENGHLLDYSATTTDIDSARFDRLTNENDRYYSYLYGAICLKEIAFQWKNAGFPISDRPELLATLFNIGFVNSKPNATPQVGGAEIVIGTTIYSFGGLAGDFYYSDELPNEFPRN